MSSAVFHKMTGSGNDFVMLDGRNTSLGQWPLERIVSVCDRREGIGADGLVFVTPLGDNRVQMVYFNADGSRAAMCGNAALCSTRFAAALEMADPAGMILVTDSGEFPTRCVGEGNQAELNLPDVDLPREVAIELLPGEHGPRLGVVGVPHLVTMVDDLQSVDVAGRGRELRYHPAAGEAGANANFYGRLKCESTEAAAPTWGLRTYERGVEGVLGLVGNRLEPIEFVVGLLERSLGGVERRPAERHRGA